MEKTIEEKAKRYDEAIKRAKAMIPVAANQEEIYNSVITIFPELKESEGEMIRKEMIEIIGNEAKEFPSSIIALKANSWIDWLKKQGEQKHIPWYDLEKSKEAGYTIVPNEEYDRLIKPAKWSKEDEEISSAIVKRLEGSCALSVDLQSAICWVENVKDRVQPKQEWSEEDELTKNALINLVEMYYGGCIDKSEKNRLLDFLKSLRPHNQWKPSEEQIEALLKLEEMHVLEHEKNQENAHLYIVIKSIREQLLKLREEDV